jgi:uncharacterized membrane protein (DUF106 family)
MAGRRRTTNTDEVVEEVIDTTEPTPSKRKELNLIKHTETIDRLVIQNKNLQKDLDEADAEIVDLENKLTDNSIKISKNMLYTFLGVIVFLAWILNAKIVTMSETMVETKHIMQEYKTEIEKVKLYNDILKEKLKNKE